MHRSARPPLRRRLPTATFGSRTGLRVRLLLTGTFALGATTSLAACGGPEPAHCVERGTGRVVPEAQCAGAGVSSDEFGGAGDSVRTQRSGGFVPGFFMWYYGGRVVNGLVSGGRYAPTPGVRYRSPSGMRTLSVPRSGGTGSWSTRPAGSAVSRGGFGATGAGRFGGG